MRRDGLAGLVGLGAVAGAIGGVLRVIAAFTPYEPSSAWLEALYGACDLGMMFGLIAVYMATSSRTGRAGLMSFAVALAALASIVGPDAQAFGVDFYRVGAMGFALALAVFACVLLTARVFAPAAVLWIACAVSGLVAATTGSAPAFVFAGVALGLGFIASAAGLLTLARHASA